MIAWSANERERCADFGVTLRQDFGVSAQSNAQGGDAQSNAAKRRLLFQSNENRCRATLAAVDGGINHSETGRNISDRNIRGRNIRGQNIKSQNIRSQNISDRISAKPVSRLSN